MPKPATAPSFATLVQRFFTEHLTHHRSVSPRTVAAYSDTLRLLLQFAERHTGKSPTDLKLVDLDAKVVLAFLDHLERDRKNGARSRNARLPRPRRCRPNALVDLGPVVFFCELAQCDTPLNRLLVARVGDAIEPQEGSLWPNVEQLRHACGSLDDCDLLHGAHQGRSVP